MKKTTILLVLLLASMTGCSDDPAPKNTDTLADAQSGDDADSPDASTDTSDPSDAATDSGADSGADTGSDTGQTDAGTDDPLACPALPASDGGTEVRIGPDRAGELPQLVREAAPGTTFLLEDGTYKPGSHMHFKADGVTFRSVSNDATKVIIDGEYNVTEPFYITASDVTIAHITVKRAIDHPVHVTPGGGSENVTGTLLYGLRIIDGGEQFVKVNPNGDDSAFVDDGRIECSYFEMTDQGRPNVERNPGGCYTGGVDVHSSQGWVVRNNEFHGIYCVDEGLAEHAIHFWSASRDTVVENNLIVNCARGIGFGLVENGQDRQYADNPYPNAGYIGHYDGIIRNNVIYADNASMDTGIELAQARGAKVYHNTILATDGATKFYSSIDYRFSNTDVDIRNNLVNRITRRNDAQGQVENNSEEIAAGLFVDAANFDFHLRDDASVAIDKGVTVEESGIDIDGETHDKGAAPDLGADEAR
ncbi:hypothetical protein FIV42_25070 [Persicimonas caeni]|uniref:Right handed beta helix domain-containing protein n=1 Tax=Persicimonas caeni TaxID=2292766 RepID=A0A4Y6Q003_PERCE|nr:hypothetical protein [Persicimonas caeni]QDG53894.1 hypothetical protein FIV42_25070 [Persicimonas caeni]QED35115.1 hypothetical protein FRD00_25065 [Persicimonas caeni]